MSGKAYAGDDGMSSQSIENIAERVFQRSVIHPDVQESWISYGTACILEFKKSLKMQIAAISVDSIFPLGQETAARAIVSLYRNKVLITLDDVE